ncbi:MAG: hypothetical protein U0936_23755 [Planctomycetaceae bacterium]
MLIRAVTVGHTLAQTLRALTAGQVAESLNTSGIYSTVKTASLSRQFSDRLWSRVLYSDVVVSFDVHLGVLAVLRTDHDGRRVVPAIEVR